MQFESVKAAPPQLIFCLKALKNAYHIFVERLSRNKGTVENYTNERTNERKKEITQAKTKYIKKERKKDRTNERKT